MTLSIERPQERRIARIGRSGGRMTKVAGTFHVPSARPSDSVESKTGHGGYGTWNVPATLRGLVATEAV